MPKVSVITPTYNRAKVLPNAIESVQQQTLQSYEHIIIDDGSTDETEEVVASFDDHRIQYIYTEENNGANAARNRGIKEATGEFVAFLDSDDKFRPEKLEICIRELESASKDYAGIFHSVRFENDGELTDISIVQDGEVVQADLFNGNPIGGFSDFVVRSEIFKQVGELDEDLPAYQDYEFFLRVLDSYSMFGITNALSIKNRLLSEDDETRISDQINVKIQAQEILIEKHSNLISKKIQSEFHYTRGFLYMGEGNIKKSKQEFKKSIQIYPKNPLYFYHYVASLGGLQTLKYAVEIKKKIKLIMSNNLAVGRKN